MGIPFILAVQGVLILPLEKWLHAHILGKKRLTNASTSPKFFANGGALLLTRNLFFSSNTLSKVLFNVESAPVNCPSADISEEEDTAFISSFLG